VPHRSVLVGVLVLAVVGGGIGAALVKTSKPLSALVVASPLAHTVPTAEGAGGDSATRVFDTDTNAPVGPFRYLKPTPETIGGKAAGNQPAFWKVWWNKTTGETAVVSLAQHVNSSDAQGAVTALNSENSDAATLSSGGLKFTSDTPLTIPGIPGALGYQLQGTVKTSSGNPTFDVDMALFSRGSVAALITDLAGGRPNTASFVAFAQGQYAAMSEPAVLVVIRAVLIILAVGGAVGLLIMLRVRRRRPAAVEMGALWPGAPGLPDVPWPGPPSSGPGGPWPAPSGPGSPSGPGGSWPVGSTRPANPAPAWPPPAQPPAVDAPPGWPAH
jgi:hypothetical protein